MAEVIVPPTPDRPIVSQRHGVVGSRRDLGEDAGDGNGHGDGAGAVHQGIVSQLPGEIAPPAPDGAVAFQRQTERRADGDLRGNRGAGHGEVKECQEEGKGGQQADDACHKFSPFSLSHCQHAFVAETVILSVVHSLSSDRM